MKTALRLFAVLGGLGVTALILAGSVSVRPERGYPKGSPQHRDTGFYTALIRANRAQHAEWRDEGLEPGENASDLAVARRLSLALVGSSPSLEEVRRFEAWPEGTRIDRHVDWLLADPRSADYLAERFARALVGDENGPFLVFRRRRFVHWLADRLEEGAPYDEIIRSVVTAKGLWTDRPEVNFLTATLIDDTARFDTDKLAVRVSRSMLGVRLDCAQCHDHPFDERWKQSDFQALAAFFNATGFGAEGEVLAGVMDLAEPLAVDESEAYPVEAVEPRVPYSPELADESLPPRERLAAWITHPENRAFARAAVNRFWALLVGEPLVEPIDDLPPEGSSTPVVEALADEFIRSGYDWRRLVRLIAATDAYRLDSRGGDGDATFPVTRLRGEQVAGAIAQSSQVRSIDRNSHILLQLVRYFGQQEFLERYGDLGAQEMEATDGAITQRLLMLNGEIVDDSTEPNPFAAVGRIAALAPNDASAVEAAYLSTLTRRPTEAELRHFTQQLSGAEGDERARVVSDLYWALVNSTEFSWNH